MYRIAKQSLYLQLGDQLCHVRPLLLLQRPVMQVNVILPDRIRFFYPGPDGRALVQELEVRVLGENAHGICFLTGVCHVENTNAADAANAAASAATTGTAPPAVTVAFRMDLIAGPITRLQSGERMTLQDWERRVRRRFAMDCKTDALPLSSMLIGTS
jgi:hypothetical protein